MEFDLYPPIRESAFDNLVPINSFGKSYFTKIVNLRNSILFDCEEV
jgi:hypothetical protein